MPSMAISRRRSPFLVHKTTCKQISIRALAVRAGKSFLNNIIITCMFLKLRDCITCPRTKKREETVIYWLHGDLSYVAHSFLFKGEEPPVSIACDERLTVEHILLICSGLIETRETFYSLITDGFILWIYISEYLKKIYIFGILWKLSVKTFWNCCFYPFLTLLF